ncbi:MAG: M56 family metallopeptidase [Fimbriimonas sp.]
MTPYLDLLGRLLIASLVIVPGLMAGLAVTRWVPLTARAKVWTLRLSLLGVLFAFAGVGLPVSVATVATEGSAPSLAWLSLGIGLYAAGVLTHVFDFVRAARIIRSLRRSARSVSRDVTKTAIEVAGIAGLRQAPRTLQAATGESVLLVAGKPLAILLPPIEMDAPTLRLALAHEMAHVRHRDLLWSAVASLAQTLLWFHPLVRMAARQLGAWQESAADHAALASLNAPPRQYAEMLIRLATARKEIPALGATAASVKEEVEGRLRALYATPSAPWGLALAAVATAIALIPLRPVAAIPEVRAMRAISPRTMAPVAAPVGRVFSPIAR